MVDSLKVSGDLAWGPQQVSDAAFPSAKVSFPLMLTPPEKVFNVGAPGTPRNVNSPSGYVTLAGVGATDTVSRGEFLYLRTSVGMLVRITTDNAPGSDVVSVIPVKGMLLLELDNAKPLKLLEVQGSGYVEWLVTGNQ